MERVSIDSYGLQGDREWAIIDSDHQCLTARDYPQLLHIAVDRHGHNLSVYYRQHMIDRLSVDASHLVGEVEIYIHSYTAFGLVVDTPLNDWLSALLMVPSRLVVLSRHQRRPVLAKHGGRSGDVVGFGDQAPILLLSEDSVSDLNQRLEVPIGADRFRANIMLSGCLPYQEDEWKTIRIGTAVLRVIQACKRCVLVTIDPIRLRKNPQGEPLRTLAGYRVGPNGGVVLGVHATIIQAGDVEIHDIVEVIE